VAVEAIERVVIQADPTDKNAKEEIMNRQSRFKRFVAIRAGAVLLMAVAVAAISAPTASAAPFTLDFEGVGDFANIQNYYNGGRIAGEMPVQTSGWSSTRTPWH
jgi:hypothetical protein